MSDEATVLLDVTGPQATIMLNRPDAQNAFDEKMIGELQDTLDKVAKMDDVAAVVLRGKGRSFSAGADIKWMKRAAEYDEARNQEDARRLSVMLATLDWLPQVTIAMVHGAAMGGGLGLACCCDIVIADQAVAFSTSEVKMGLIPATIAPYVIGAIGARQARRWFQTAERIPIERAVSMGLVHEVVGKAEDLERRCNDLVLMLGENGPKAMRAAKALCREIGRQTVDDATRERTSGLIAALRASPEGKEGMSAFLEKRRPSWIKVKAD